MLAPLLLPVIKELGDLGENSEVSVSAKKINKMALKNNGFDPEK